MLSAEGLESMTSQGNHILDSVASETETQGPEFGAGPGQTFVTMPVMQILTSTGIVTITKYLSDAKSDTR